MDGYDNGMGTTTFSTMNGYDYRMGYYNVFGRMDYNVLGA